MRKTFIQTIIAVLICVFLVAVGVTAVTVIFPSQGGTGKSSWTQYAIPYLSGTTAFGEIGIGSEGEYLKVDTGATNYTWGTPAGAGDVESVGDCASGACLDGSSDGGTYIRLYDGDSNYAELNVGNIASDYIVYLPTSTGTLIHTEVDPTVDTAAEILVIIDNTALDFGTGVLTATGFSGPLMGAVTGNASTASALAADPANCGAGEYALGVDASGAVESCTDATTEINTVVNALGGTNLTCASEACNVDDAFIKLAGDATGNLTSDLNIDTNTLVVSYDDNKVGIGTASPNAPLEVKGIKPGIVGGFQSGMFQVTDMEDAEFSNAVITGHNAYNTNTQLWYLGSMSSSDNKIGFLNRQNAAIHFYTNNAFRMAIDATGDVGIGVTDPDTKLEVFNAGNQLKLSFDGTDNTIFAVDTSGDLTITPSGTQIIVSGNISATNLSGTNTGDNDEVGTLTSGDLCINDGSAVNCTVNTIAELETALDALDILTVTTDDVSSANMLTLISDETGTGVAVFGTAPTFTTGITITGADADPDAAGNIRYDSTITGIMSGGGLRWYDDDSIRLLVDLETDPSDDDYVVAYDSTADGFYMKQDADTGGTPTVITVADTTDTTSWVALWESATGDLEPKSDGGLTYNATTGMLTATGFTGPLTGNVTGNVSGTALTVTQAAQSAITSLGTLTTLTVDDITINANSIVSAGASSLLITPTAGQTITFDGTITLDAGVIAGATSITSTGFTGALTGNASTATALAGDPTDCAANTFADAINASGTLTCNAVVSADITADTITHANILDTDQMDTKCLYFEDPVATDDFLSIWSNRTANAFQVTEIWAESDQTVTFMLQLDDGTPADCDSVDLAPAAGTAEDTALDGDCLVSANEQLDLATTSVANTPTWVSICFTGNWVD